MPQQRSRFHMRDTILLTGWLFADLLLALFVIFLASNTSGIKAVPPTPTPTPTPTPVIRATPTPQPRLELTYHEFTMTVDSNGLLNDSQAAINDVIRQVELQPFLQGRSAGLVVVYGGAPTDADISSAQNIATKVYSVLANVGKQFKIASFYKPLYYLGNNITFVIVDIYLFAK